MRLGKKIDKLNEKIDGMSDKINQLTKALMHVGDDEDLRNDGTGMKCDFCKQELKVYERNGEQTTYHPCTSGGKGCSSKDGKLAYQKEVENTVKARVSNRPLALPKIKAGETQAQRLARAMSRRQKSTCKPQRPTSSQADGASPASQSTLSSFLDSAASFANSLFGRDLEPDSNSCVADPRGASRTPDEKAFRDAHRARLQAKRANCKCGRGGRSGCRC